MYYFLLVRLCCPAQHHEDILPVLGTFLSVTTYRFERVLCSFQRLAGCCDFTLSFTKSNEASSMCFACIFLSVLNSRRALHL